MRYGSTQPRFARRMMAVAGAALMVAGIATAVTPSRVVALGEVFTLTPATVQFGSQALGTSTTATVTLTNGDQELSIGAFTIGWFAMDEPNPFSIRPNLGCTAITTLPPLGSCDVTVDFLPQFAGSKYATLQSYLGGQQPPDVNLYGTGLPTSNVAWSASRVIRGGAWTNGDALARTTNGSAAYLHSLYNTDLIGGKWATDTGPRAGVYYRRSTNGGSSFGTPLRLNPTTQHASRGVIAASGSKVHGLYVTQTKWIKYSKTAPRVIYVRANANYGTGSWGSARRLTSLTGRVDYPSMAVYGSVVYVAYTDAATGGVKIAISRNGGSTFTTKGLGTTTNTISDGKAGLPSVSAYGSLVVVAWTADAHGKVVVKVSRDAGKTWAGNTLAATAHGSATTHAVSGRMSVAWPTASGLSLRTWKPARWGPVVAIAPPGPSGTYSWYDTPAIALRGTGQAAAAWSACHADCSSATPKIDLVWSESTDGGASFGHAQVIVDGTAGGATYPQNWYPSVVWASATTRYITYTAETLGDGVYTVQFRTGSGKP